MRLKDKCPFSFFDTPHLTHTQAAPQFAVLCLFGGDPLSILGVDVPSSATEAALVGVSIREGVDTKLAS